MEHVVKFLCIQIQLQDVLFYAYDVIFMTEFSKSNKLYIASGSATPPPPLKGKILGAHLGGTHTTTQRHITVGPNPKILRNGKIIDQSTKPVWFQ
jgi:hypothetical protein